MFFGKPASGDILRLKLPMVKTQHDLILYYSMQWRFVFVISVFDMASIIFLRSTDE